MLPKAGTKERSFSIKFQNQTARTHLTEKAPIELLEVAERLLTVSLPPLTCAIGHTVSLEITGREAAAGLKAIVTGRVLKAEPTSDSLRAELKLIQINPTEWNAILAFFDLSTDSAQDLLMRMKGE